MNPAISVCIPTFNHATYLGLAVDSVLAQTRSDFEIIIADDASTDATPEIVASFDDTRIKYQRHPRQLGIARCRNACLARARGRYIAWLDSDDLLYPEMLASLTSYLDEQAEIGLAHGGFHVIDRDGCRKADWPAPFDEATVEAGSAAFRELILCNYITTGAVVLRRECYDRAGSYCGVLRNSSEDWDMWLRIARDWTFAYDPAPVMQYRQHGCNTSAASRASGERLRHDIRVVKRNLKLARSDYADWKQLARQANLALAWRLIDWSSAAHRQSRFGEAFVAAMRAQRLTGRFFGLGERLALLSAAAGDGEFRLHSLAVRMQEKIAAALSGTRFAQRPEVACWQDASWQATLQAIAAKVRQVVPRTKCIAVIDKCDPTVLHLSERRGCHFPDPHFLSGYPPDGAVAVAHLEQVRRNGADYLVVPFAAAWWLDHYRELKQHLDRYYVRAWVDDHCQIFDLTPQPREVTWHSSRSSGAEGRLRVIG